MKGSLRRVLNDYQTVKRILPQVLANSRDRQATMDILNRLVKQQRVGGLVDAVIEIYENGQLQDLLTIINEYSTYRPK